MLRIINELFRTLLVSRDARTQILRQFLHQHHGSESVSRDQEGELNDISGKTFHKEDFKLHFWTIKEIKHYK
jgi:hypothetical protein